LLTNINRNSKSLPERVSWPIVIGGLALMTIAPPVASPYLWAWCELTWIFLGFKAIVLAKSKPEQLRRMGTARLAGFVFLWPGMDVRPFLQAERHPLRMDETECQKVRRWGLHACSNIAIGVALFWLLGHSWVQSNTYLYVAIGMSSVALIVLFGAFSLLTVLWRVRGVDVDRQWHNLFGSRSLAEYWSTRWNEAFHDFARDHVYLPIKRRWSRGVALAGSFLFSGILHDVIISVPARGGYGLPTLYFVLQGFGIWLERRLRLSTPRRWLMAAAFVLGPLPLLFHQPFLHNVIVPQLIALRGSE
jgi:hypothetical protein